jgi:uncharacterized membrane protein YfcA
LAKVTCFRYLPISEFLQLLISILACWVLGRGVDVDARHAALAAMGLFVAGLVKGTTGLGYSTCTLPFLVAAIGLKAAIVIVPIPAMAANIGLLLGAGHIRETIHRFWKFYAATVPGIFFGTMLLGSRRRAYLDSSSSFM